MFHPIVSHVITKIIANPPHGLARNLIPQHHGTITNITVGSLTGMDCRRVQKKDLRKKSVSSPVNSSFGTFILFLVGGFNPFEKY